MKTSVAAQGLEGVIAARSAVSSIIGDRLTFRGYDVTDLVEYSTFEETAFLLWNGESPTSTELSSFSDELARAYVLPAAITERLPFLAGSGAVMDQIRTVLSLLGQNDPDAGEMSADANRHKSIRILAQFPTVVTAIGRASQGSEPVAPDPALSLAANFLYMLHGEVPSDLQTRAMDRVLILLADHELNASTFAARVAASTLTDMDSAVLAAFCTLKGPLHGGAIIQVHRMLSEIDSGVAVSAWVQDARARKERVPGFGHRVYRAGDPRAKVLKDLSLQLAESVGDRRWYDTSIRLEEEVGRALGLLPNVDLFAASVYTYLGIPPVMFTPVFAISRVSGWIAHIMEQYADNRLIRPRAEYVGSSYRAYSGRENHK